MLARRTPLVAATAVALTATLTGCGGTNPAAQAAYDECADPDAEINLFELDGRTVTIALTGEDARALAGSDDAGDNLTNQGEFDDDDVSGLLVALEMVTGVNCMVEATNYPGSSDQLEDGDEWDGWRYTEDEGAGSEVTVTFESTS